MAENTGAKKGRKSKIDIVEKNLDVIKKYAANGANEKQICAALGIAESTFNVYKRQLPELAKILHEGRTKLVTDLRSMLIKKAFGFTYEEKKNYIKEEGDGTTTSYTEITTKQALPDLGSISLALKNYDDEWFNDKKMYDLKAQELELRKKMAEQNIWE